MVKVTGELAAIVALVGPITSGAIAAAALALDLDPALDAPAVTGLFNIADLGHIGVVIASETASLALGDADTALNCSLAAAAVVSVA